MKSRTERRRFLELIWCCCLLLLEGVVAEERPEAGDDHFWTCGPGISTPGITLPRGDVSLLFGQPLEILCLLNTQDKKAEGRNSSDLLFYRNMELVQSEFLTVVNSTALRMHIPRPSPSDSVYYCKLRLPDKDKLMVCYNKVVVGERPTLDNNFRCLSQNWDNLTCTWKPKHNYLVTTYNLTYRLPGRSGRSATYTCNNMTVETNDGTYSCFWDVYTTPLYRQSIPHFHFTLTASNKLSENVSRDFHINHFARMRPGRPTDLKVENKTQHSALLSWSIPYSLQNFPPGLLHRVIYSNEVDGDGIWSVSDVSSLPLHNSSYVFNVTGLVYAYCHYTVRVSIRSEKAYEEEMWSDYTPVTFRTSEEPPVRPPDTDEGGFESVANLTHRSIFLYWRQILSHEENGDNFTYNVGVHMEGMKLDVAPFKWTKSYIWFKGLPLRPLEFLISSANNVGESPSKSRMIVPEQNQLLPEPLSFTKAALGNGTYELTWRHPMVNMSGVSDYTIFWCENYRDRPYQCDGRLQWERVPASLTARNFTVTEDKIYQFAISANGYGTSSGMVWASCTIIPNTAIGKIKDTWTTNPQSTSITVNWKLECPDNVGVIKGYRIFYCPIDGLIDTKCKEPVKNITVEKSVKIVAVRGADDPQANITGLRPYTTYAIQVAIIAHHEVGPQSDTLIANTLEGAPDPPRNVRVSDLSNTRMLVSWDPPLRTNGVIKDYRVSYRAPYEDWISVHVDEGRENPKATFRERLITNLSSYTNYSVRVEACTTVCSNWSQSLLVRSAIGSPGVVGQPSVQSSESYHRVLWEPPKRAGGTLDLYEVKVLKVGKDFNDTIIYNTTDMELEIKEKMCLLEGVYAYQYSVRAVNYDAAEDHGAAAFSHHDRVQVNRRPAGDTSVALYRGPWSPVAENTCTPAYSSTGFYWVLMVVGMVFVAAFLFMGGKWLYRKIDTMSSIKPVMPDGLIQSDLDKDAYPWVLPPKRIKESEKHSQYPPASADEVSLLGRPTPAPASPGTRDMSGFSATTTSTSLSGGSSRRAPSPNSGTVWDAPYFGAGDDLDPATPTNVDSEACNPYSTIRCLDDSEGTPTNTDNPYVTVAPEFPKLSNGYVQARPLPVPQVLGPPQSPPLPANYVRTAPEKCPVVCSPYVAVDDPRIRASMPASVPLNSLLPKVCIPLEPSGGGYVKHDDVMFSGPCAVVEPGRPLVAKRISAPPLVLGKQPLGEDKRTSLCSEPPYSPEYCRFGWKPEEPPSLVLQEYQLSPEDYKLSLEDYKLSPEDYKQELEQEAAPGCTPLTPASHYLPLNVPTLQS